MNKKIELTPEELSIVEALLHRLKGSLPEKEDKVLLSVLHKLNKAMGAGE